MSSDPSRSPGVSPDDALPPVEPPSAGFIVQLFVVPGVIVLVVILIWVLFNWLAQKGNDGEAFVRDLARNNEGRWQAAFNLAHELRAEHKQGQPRLTADPKLAANLAGILHDEIKSGSLEENPLALRVYLCRALGEFKVPDGLPTLLEAATTVRDEKEADVRRAALEGIALLANNVGPSDPHFADNKQLEEVLLEAAGDSDPRTRSVAAVALGIVGTPPMIEKLRFLLADANPDVRYNAATRLAQRGDTASNAVLAEMLDPDERAGLETEEKEEMRPFKHALIVVNALRAVEQLSERNPDADLSELQAAVDKLLASQPDAGIRIEATDVRRRLAERGK
jgi:HEAT repeat protein